MQIVDKQIEKIAEIFKILECSPVETEKHLEKIKKALFMEAAAEAFAEKGQFPEDANFSEEEVEDFLLDNFDESEIAKIVATTSRDVMVEYFSKIIKDESEEKKEKINEILEIQFS